MPSPLTSPSALFFWTLAVFSPTGWDLAVFLSLWLSNTIHMPFSVGYHLFTPISPEVRHSSRCPSLFQALIRLTGHCMSAGYDNKASVEDTT